MCSGPSKQEKQAAKQTAAFSKQLQDQFTTEFKQSQALVSFLTAQLEPMITDPTGFTPQQMSDLQSNLIQNVGAQVAAAKQQAQEAFDTANEAGLPSGVNAMNEALIAGAGVQAEAGGLNTIQIQSAQLAQQKQQFAEEMVAGLNQTLTSQGGTTGSQTVSNQATQFQQADTMAQQSTQMWSNLLSGVIGAGTSFLTGGVSSLLRPPAPTPGAAAQIPTTYGGPALA
jgi:hypothetical protein